MSTKVVEFLENNINLTNLSDDEKELLVKKFSQFKRLPKESNNICPNYFNPYHDPRNWPGACRYCLWDGVLTEEGM